MKRATFNRKITPKKVRNAKEALVEEILDRCTTRPDERKWMAKMIMLYANRYKLTETDLHAHLKKEGIRNFTAFTKWTFGMVKK